MFRTILTPLRARFDLSPRTAVPALPSSNTGTPNEVAPEDFARDVLVEIMRNSVMKLKETTGLKLRLEVLDEIQRVMTQDAVTKDVFRDVDGFQALISVLATISLMPGEETHNAVDASRICIVVISEAMHAHQENTNYFKHKVGYGTLVNAVRPLVAEERISDHTLGLMLGLALHDFSGVGVFTAVKGESQDMIDVRLGQFSECFQTIRRRGAFLALWQFLSTFLAQDASLRYTTYKILDMLSLYSHRNQALLSSLGIVGPLFDSWNLATTDAEKSLLSKLMRRLLDMGAVSTHARPIIQKSLKDDGTLDLEVLDLVRYGMRSRWLDHFSMEPSATLIATQEKVKGLPATGLSFMAWLWLEALPKKSHALFTAQSSRLHLQLRIDTSGKLELRTSAKPEMIPLPNSSVRPKRWAHVALVHYPHKASNPTLRIFIDGVLSDSHNLLYPKMDSSAQTLNYTLGDFTSSTRLSWCLASAHLFSVPLNDEILRFTHHLGPRYTGNFQDASLVKFLTYEASTSLNMFLSIVAASPRANAQSGSPLLKVVRLGPGIKNADILFSLFPVDFSHRPEAAAGSASGGKMKEFRMAGDVFLVRSSTMDQALWKVGGAAVALRLVQAASSAHELSRSLGVLTDGLRNSWQNSDDMERLRGYEILADVLREKACLVNVTGFETIFEFLGINFRNPDHSTITNTLAYRALALDFELWSRTKREIQELHFEHFTLVLQTSRFAKFNIKQRLSKMGLVRRLLFALQTDWYDAKDAKHEANGIEEKKEGKEGLVEHLVEAIRVAADSNFGKDEAIKPLVSYLAANLHEEPPAAPGSPASVVSHAPNGREAVTATKLSKAILVLSMFVNLLSSPTNFAKFSNALPVTRIVLLLLGDKPTSIIAQHVLALLTLGVKTSPSFARKFELVSGWNVLKSVLTNEGVWDLDVQNACVDVLLGRMKEEREKGATVIVCPNMAGVILTCVKAGLRRAVDGRRVGESMNGDTPHNPRKVAEETMEAIMEELMTLHASSATFRELFKSAQATQTFIDAYKMFVQKANDLEAIDVWMTSMLDKLNHFGLALALDNNVAGGQKREILDIIASVEQMLHDNAETTAIDPSLVQDERSMRTRLSARLSLQVGERTILKTATRMGEWRQTIQTSEKKRLRKNILDHKETRRQVARLYECLDALTSERGLWAHEKTSVWRMDETEGPHRVRKRLEPMDSEAALDSRVDGVKEDIRSVSAPSIDGASALNQVEVPPWAESYEIAATEIEENGQLAEEITDDKHRRVRHELEPGDVIEAVATVARIAGVDSSPGLLIIGKTHVYMLDGIVENEEGEVIDAHDAPKSLFFVPGSIVELDGPQRAQRWSHSQIQNHSNKTFLFRDVGLEMFFKDSRSLLVVFQDKKQRASMASRLTEVITRADGPPTPGLLRTPLLKSSSRSYWTAPKVTNDLATAQYKWQAREISNFTYLSLLNQISGRTPSDATQYPVFPWVLSDYTSTSLDLTSESSYRDLTKPMGALTAARSEAAATRYSNLASVEEQPFHYGTHFSSSMIVCHFLIRLAPFTHMFKTLQGGDWDLPDRLFSDVGKSYESAALDIRGDVRELIPEFFTCPEFLENSANHDFGVLSGTGEKIHDVGLPPWAKGDPLLFVELNRRALESSYVSAHLHEWIDLIWGVKQRDPESLNCFHPLSYEGAVDLDKITDELEREATVGIIHNFGQTPRKLFTAPHPARFTRGNPALPIGSPLGIPEDPHLLVQDARCFKDLGVGISVNDFGFDEVSERMLPCAKGMVIVPGHPYEQLEWNPNRKAGSELRYILDNTLMQSVEAIAATCISFADSNTFATGCNDYTVRLWRIVRHGPSRPPELSMSHIMRNHTAEVTCVYASRQWSLVVSGSKDGSVALWDLNRGVYVRSIWHGESGAPEDAISLVTLNESTGHIASCSKTKLWLHTVNGRPMAMLDLTTLANYSALIPSVTAMAFHEREYSAIGLLATGSVDGTITLRTWTTDGTREGEKAKWRWKDLRSLKVRNTPTRGAPNPRPPAVTALRFHGENLYHGEETGKSFMWKLPDD
ncbi:beach-domain-containing protein [Flagelloscypha sp. PMI_526]|nr:beach-domain-containing protein [Flagelloscypha sp. PMI_526]